MKRPLNFLATALATTALSAGLMLSSPAAFAANATLNNTSGNSCDYSAVSIATNGDITVTCGTTGTPATISIGTVGALDAGLPDTAAVPVTCSGTGCSGVAVSVAVSPAVTGVDVIGSATHNFAGSGTHSFNVGGTAPATGTPSATVVVTVTSEGTATTMTPPLNGTVSKSIPIVDSTAPGTLSFSPSLASVTEGGSAITVSVLRTGSGANAPSVDVVYTCSSTPAGYTPGITPASGSTLAWSGADATAKTFTINPTTVPDTTAGTVTCTLGTTSGGAIPSTTQFVLTVNKAGGGGSCSTVADVNYDLSTSAATKQQYRLPNMKTVAMKIAAFRGGRNISRVSTTLPAPGEYQPAGFHMAVSECPGDFTTSQGPGCSVFTTRSGINIGFGSGCMLDPAKKYYLNVRFVNPATGASTCSTPHCGAYSNLNYD